MENKINFKDLSKNELIKLCLCQKREIELLKARLDYSQTRNNLLNMALDNYPIPYKISVCLQESQSLLNDIEMLKIENMEIKNGTKRNNLNNNKN